MSYSEPKNNNGSPLQRLLFPQSIAVFGGVWAQKVIANLKAVGFAGAIWPVHPKHETICGLKCYRNVAELPGAPDASFIGTNRFITLDLIADLNQIGAGGAVVFSSGYKESDEQGARIQHTLLQRAGDMAIMGPNCYGFINYMDQVLMWPDTHGGSKVSSGVALISQSSNIAINMTMYQSGLDIALIATVGNQAHIESADLIDCLVEDSRITAVGLYMEGLGDAEKIARALIKAQKLGKQVVVLKSGRTQSAQRLTLSHTASMSGSDDAVDAFLQYHGTARVHTLPQLMESLKLAASGTKLSQPQLVSMSCSGGEASLMADLGQDVGVVFPPFSEAHAQAIGEVVHPLVQVSNPFDYHTFDWGDYQRLKNMFAAVMADGIELVALVIDLPHAQPSDLISFETALEAFAHARWAQHESCRPTAIVISTFSAGLNASAVKKIRSLELIPMVGMQEALIAIRAAAQPQGTHRPPFKRTLLNAQLSDQATVPLTLDEWQSKRLLREMGIATPSGERCDHLAQALDACKRWERVVCKAISADLSHKTEARAVAIDVKAEDREATLKHLFSLAPSVLIEEYLPGGVEILLGVSYDPCIGHTLTVAAGGILTELLHDRVLLMLQSSPEEIHQALTRLKIFKRIKGWRNQPAADVTALITCIVKLMHWVHDHAHELVELDINPLSVYPQGAVALDGLVRLVPKIQD